MGGKLTDHMAVRPRQGRVDFVNILGRKLGQFGGGGGGGGGVDVWGGGGGGGELPLRPPP